MNGTTIKNRIVEKCCSWNIIILHYKVTVVTLMHIKHTFVTYMYTVEVP